MSNYTKEPWKVGTHGIISKIVDRQIDDCEKPDGFYGGQLIAESVEDRNAFRIVACVNACSGMVNPAIEIATLKAQRDELLKAIRKVEEETWAPYDSRLTIREVARTAIANAERSTDC